MKTSRIYNDDCFNAIKNIKKPVDMILFDPPYGTSAAKWDKIIDFKKMWTELYKVIKPNGVIAVFSATPFDKLLSVSNIKRYKYEYIWVKEQGTNQLNAKKQPLRKHENILIFYKKKPTYNIQFSEGEPYHIKRNMENVSGKQLYGQQKNETETINTGFRYPTSIQYFNRPIKDRIHPTQKPLGLLEFLIKTYTNEGETVLDICMGSGSTGVAALNTNRNFIGIESNNFYFNKAKDWLFSLTNVMP